MAQGFKGLSELIEGLLEMPEQLKGEAAKHITAAANSTESEVRQKYAQGPTGALLRGVGQKSDGPLSRTVYSRAKHVHFFEDGTVERFHKSGKSVGEMKQGGTTNPGKPTFRPAAGRARRRLNSEYERMLRNLKVKHMTGRAT